MAPRSDGRSRTRSGTRARPPAARSALDDLGLGLAARLGPLLLQHRHAHLAEAGRVDRLLDRDDTLAAQAQQPRLRVARPRRFSSAETRSGPACRCASSGSSAPPGFSSRTTARLARTPAGGSTRR